MSHNSCNTFVLPWFLYKRASKRHEYSTEFSSEFLFDSFLKMSWKILTFILVLVAHQAIAAPPLNNDGPGGDIDVKTRGIITQVRSYL